MAAMLAKVELDTESTQAGAPSKNLDKCSLSFFSSLSVVEEAVRVDSSTCYVVCSKGKSTQVTDPTL